MKFEITKDELEQLKNDVKEGYTNINQLLCDDIETILAQQNAREYTKKTVAKQMDKIKNSYEVMVKNFYHHAEETQTEETFFIGTNIARIDKLKNEANISQFLKANTTKEGALHKKESEDSRLVLLELKQPSQIPYIKLEQEVIFPPFTTLTIQNEISNDEATTEKIYSIRLQEQELKPLEKESAEELYENLLQNTVMLAEKIETCQQLDLKNAEQYENIRKLEQLIAKHNFTREQENYEQDTTEEERQKDLEDITRINTELTSLKNSVTDIFRERLENVKAIAEWKEDFATYMKSEFAQIRTKYDQKINQKETANDSKKEEESFDNDQEITFVPTGDTVIDSAKSEALENIAVVKTLLTNIKNLISKQQNHARIAEAMDSNYKALNNAFEMKNFAEELDALVKAIFNKIDTISPKNEEELSKISKTNLQVSILLNYLNNAKAGVGKRITRFDEMHIMEENELKKEIAETIKNIRCEAELKKLTDDIDIIEEKSNIRKFFGRFTR